MRIERILPSNDRRSFRHIGSRSYRSRTYPSGPNKGGPSEFVPQRYQFATLEQAAEIIAHVFNDLQRTEQIKIRQETGKFSNSYYIIYYYIMDSNG
jgi:hypothetical protein